MRVPYDLFKDKAKNADAVYNAIGDYEFEDNIDTWLIPRINKEVDDIASKIRSIGEDNIADWFYRCGHVKE